MGKNNGGSSRSSSISAASTISHYPSTIYANSIASSPRTISAHSMQSTGLLPDMYHSIERRTSASARMTHQQSQKKLTRRASIGGKAKKGKQRKGN
jgi:hypothetical protein